MAMRPEDPKHLKHKREVDEQRRTDAIARKAQEALRNLTPGVATPGSVKKQMDRSWIDKANKKEVTKHGEDH